MATPPDPPPSFSYFPIFHNRPSSHSEDPETASMRDELEKEALRRLPIGLKLNLESLDLVDSIEKQLNGDAVLHSHRRRRQRGNKARSVTNKKIASKTQELMERAEKLKADHLMCSFLRIGHFEYPSERVADLVAKCYYGKRKFAWEILKEDDFTKILRKIKMEFEWQHILAMRLTIQENGPGILQLELSQPPEFAQEMDLKPRQHTRWNTITDFTAGKQASTWRIHYLEFAPGILDTHYDKLMKDKQMFELTQKSFPSLPSPYFHPIIPLSYNQPYSYSSQHVLPSPYAGLVMDGFQHLTLTLPNQESHGFANLQDNFNHYAELFSANSNSDIGIEERYKENSGITHVNDTSTHTLQYPPQLHPLYANEISEGTSLHPQLPLSNGNFDTHPNPLLQTSQEEAMITMDEGWYEYPLITSGVRGNPPHPTTFNSHPSRFEPKR